MKANLKHENGKRGGMFCKTEAMKVAVNMINDQSGNFFSGSTEMNKDIDDVAAAKAKLDSMLAVIDSSISALREKENKAGDAAKQASGKVRDAAEKLSAGLIKIEKAANFDKLERYVELLERASKAMTVLAELDSSGKLEKIAAAIR